MDLADAITERWVNMLRAELPDRTLIRNETHVRHAIRECGQHRNLHRTHRSLAAATPMRARPQAREPERTKRIVLRRPDRPGGVFHEC